MLLVTIFIIAMFVAFTYALELTYEEEAEEVNFMDCVNEIKRWFKRETLYVNQDGTYTIK